VAKVTPILQDSALVDAEQRLALARAERDELLTFARRVMAARVFPDPDAVLRQLRREAERLVLLVAGDGPA